jgi:hypothetical protein
MAFIAALIAGFLRLEKPMMPVLLFSSVLPAFLCVSPRKDFADDYTRLSVYPVAFVPIWNCFR